MKTEQTVATYKGTPITELSRGALIVALGQAYDRIDTLQQQAMDDIEMLTAFESARRSVKWKFSSSQDDAAMENARRRIDNFPHRLAPQNTA